jgi:dynein light intermediate chain 1, cytosolic
MKIYLILLKGGTPESQRDFILTLETDPTSQSSNRNQSTSKPPIANDFALGYTYQDVLDTDHEGTRFPLAIMVPQFLTIF